MMQRRSLLLPLICCALLSCATITAHAQSGETTTADWSAALSDLKDNLSTKISGASWAIIPGAFEIINQSLTDNLTAVGTAFLKKQKELEAEWQAYVSRSMPFFDKLGVLYTARTIASAIMPAQEAQFNNMNLDYLYAHKNIGSKTNTFTRDGLVKAKQALFQRFVDYFCIPGTFAAPKGCGSKNVDGRTFGVDMVQVLVGENTWAGTSTKGGSQMAVAADFIRGFIGVNPDKLNLSDLQRGEYVGDQQRNAMGSLRLAAVNRLLVRRMPITPGKDQGAMTPILAMFKEITGQVSSSNPQATCGGDNLQDTEKFLCSMQNADGLISAAVLDRYTQHDFYMSPKFVTEIQKSDFPSKGSLEKFKVVQSAQKLAQDYQFMRDLEIYVALRAARISQEDLNADNRLR